MEFLVPFTKQTERSIIDLAKIYGYDEHKIKKCLNEVFEKTAFGLETIIQVLLSNDSIAKILGNNNFIYDNYDATADDQKGESVPFSKQEYVSRDFTKILHRRFPKFDENSIIPSKYRGLPFWEVQKIINNRLNKSQNLSWSNQTLSYTRDAVVGKHIINCIVKPLFLKNLFGSKFMIIVDVTANTGSDSIAFGMEKFVDKVVSYEIFKPAYDMLKYNINIYGFNNKIIAKNIRFDYNIPKNSFVVIDPPYESTFNLEVSKNDKANFNLSIDDTPIYYVAQKCLDSGAKCVLLSMPKFYNYNIKFAIDNDQYVEIYQMGEKNNKMFLIMKNIDAKILNRPNFKYYKVISSGFKNKQGKINPYKCKIENGYINKV